MSEGRKGKETMPYLTFRGSHVRYFDCRLQEGGAFTRIHASSDFSEPIREAMGWPQISSEIESCKLSGTLAGDNLVVTPADKTLKQYVFQMGVGEVTDFEVVRVKEEDGESVRTELRYKIRTNASSAAAQLYEYLSTVGKAPAAMKLRYSEQGTLTEQDGDASNAGEKEEVDGEQEEQQPPLDNLMNAMGSGRKKERNRRGAPVAPAVVSIEPDERKKVEQIIDKSLQ